MKTQTECVNDVRYEMMTMTCIETINVRFLTEYMEIGQPRYPQVLE